MTTAREMEGKQGYVRLYTGNGVGKTTAAFGLLLRALCAGKRAYVGQFVKDMKYNETNVATLFPDRVIVEQLGRGCFISHKPESADVAAAKEGLDRCAAMMASGVYDIVILDELTIAVYFKLLTVNNVIEAIKSRSKNTEVVITGRYAPKELEEIADVVTEMQEIKHYYTQGVLSRNGFDH